MLGFVVWSIVSIVFLVIGIRGWKDQEAVGFFTFVKPPKVKDIQQYNRHVSVIWIASAVIFEIIGLPALFLEQNSPWFILVIFSVVVLVIGMIIAYIKIEAKYRE